MPFKNPILGGNTLVREAMQSQNFAAGESGWQFTAAGDVEVNSAMIRGTVEVGIPPSTLTLTDTIPPELLAFYGSAGLGTIGAVNIERPNDFGYYYSLSATDGNTSSATLSHASGYVTLPAATVVEGEQSETFGDGTFRQTVGGSTPYILTFGQHAFVVDANGHDVAFFESFSQPVSFTSVTSHTELVGFNHTFNSVPMMGFNINSGAGPTANWHARGIGISTTAFTLFVFGPAAQTWTNVAVQWTATEPQH